MAGGRRIDAKPGGESHFNIVVVSDAFEGQSRLARQRAVKAVFDPLGIMNPGRGIA